MTTIKRLEDLEVWQLARKFVKKIYKLTEKLPPEERFNLKKHMRESVRSVAACIAEGFGRYHFKDSVKFYFDSRGSLNEIKNDLYLGFDLGYWTKEELNDHLKDLEKISYKLNTLIAATKRVSNAKNN